MCEQDQLGSTKKAHKRGTAGSYGELEVHKDLCTTQAAASGGRSIWTPFPYSVVSILYFTWTVTECA